jgi:hypothetical protein
VLVASQVTYGRFGKGVEFFPDVEPDFGQVVIHARGNLSIDEKDRLMKQVEARVLKFPGLSTVYARIGEQLRVAAMVDIVGFDPALDPKRLALIKRQAHDTFPNAGAYDEAVEWAGMRPATPSGVPLLGATAFAIFVLRTYGQPARQAEIDARIARGVAWLEEHQPVSNQDASMQLLGLVWGRADKAAIGQSVAGVRTRQRQDGGWSQLASLASDAYASGQALYSLALAGVPAKDEAYRRGVDYLLNTQAANGTWHVKARSKPFQPYFESGFPYGHDQWISAAGTSWAAMALSMSVPVPAQTAQTR